MEEKAIIDKLEIYARVSMMCKEFNIMELEYLLTKLPEEIADFSVNSTNDKIKDWISLISAWLFRAKKVLEKELIDDFESNQC